MTRWKFLVLAVFAIALLAWPALLAAQDVAPVPEPPTWVVWIKAIAAPLIEPLALVLGAVLLVLAKRFAKWLAAKLDVEDARTLSLIEGQVVKVIDGGIAFAEQKGRAWTREHGALPDGAAKLQWAIDWIVREAQRRGLPELARDALVDLVESRLGDPHAPGEAVRAEVIASRLAGSEVDS